MTSLLISNIVLWIAVIALGVVVFALTRQIGVLYERVAPAGALVIDKGPAIGQTPPVFELRDLAGQAVKIGGIAADGRSTLMFFLSSTCPVCKQLLPAVRTMAASERDRVNLVLASDGEPAEYKRFAEQHGLQALPFVLSKQLGMTYQIGKLPYAVLLDADGVVRAKGLVNSLEHLESLISAQEAGVGSLQEFMARSGKAA
ncbi:MAG TPA: methylamine dehydrogenase accessory protein MauD [Dongiaceae bacterium]|jgi:methylamine dehydrogenase accessory protein MauD